MFLLKIVYSGVCPVTKEKVNYLLSYYSEGEMDDTEWCESCGNTHTFRIVLRAEMTGTISSYTDKVIWEDGQYALLIKAANLGGKYAYSIIRRRLAAGKTAEAEQIFERIGQLVERKVSDLRERVRSL